jgi:hypothetical protein
MRHRNAATAAAPGSGASDRHCTDRLERLIGRDATNKKIKKQGRQDRGRAKLLDPSIALCVYDGGTHIATIWVGDCGYLIFSSTGDLLSTFSSHSEVLSAIPSGRRG